MKCVVAINQWSLEGKRRWHEHLAVVINSLLANTRFQPILLWTGDPVHPVVIALRQWIEVILSTQMFESIIAPIVEPGPPSTWRREVCRVVMSKCELPFLLKDDCYVVSDVDTLWLSEPPIPQFTAALLAVPNFRTLYGGMLLVDRGKWLAEHDRLVNVAQELLPARGRCYEEPVLARTFQGKWAALPKGWQKFTYDELEEKACVVHFHGPKMSQIRAFTAAIPAKRNVIVDMFLKHKERYQHWMGIAEQYYNKPYPIYDALESVLNSISKPPQVASADRGPVTSSSGAIV